MLLKLWWCFSKSHLSLLLYSTEMDCPKMRGSISKLKQLQHLQWCSICNNVNEAAIAKPSAPLIARFKQHFLSHGDSPGTKRSKEAEGCSGYSHSPSLGQDTVLAHAWQTLPCLASSPQQIKRGWRVPIFLHWQSHDGDRKTGQTQADGDPSLCARIATILPEASQKENRGFVLCHNPASSQHSTVQCSSACLQKVLMRYWASLSLGWEMCGPGGQAVHRKARGTVLALEA